MLLKLCLNKIVVSYCGVYLHYEISFMLFLKIFITSQGRGDGRGLLVCQCCDTAVTLGGLRDLRACEWSIRWKVKVCVCVCSKTLLKRLYVAGSKGQCCG